MERSTLIQIKSGGIDYTLAPNRTLTKQELVVFRQHLINAEQERLNIIKAIGTRSGSSWDFDDTEAVINRAADLMEDYGITMTKVGTPVYIDMDAAPDTPDTRNWSCDLCKNREKSYNEFPCSQCVRPAGRMFTTAE